MHEISASGGQDIEYQMTVTLNFYSNHDPGIVMTLEQHLLKRGTLILDCGIYCCLLLAERG